MRFVFVSFLENARQTRWRTGFIAAVHSTYRHASKNPHRAAYFDRGGPQTRHVWFFWLLVFDVLLPDLVGNVATGCHQYPRDSGSVGLRSHVRNTFKGKSAANAGSVLRSRTHTVNR